MIQKSSKRGTRHVISAGVHCGTILHSGRTQEGKCTKKAPKRKAPHSDFIPSQGKKHDVSTKRWWSRYLRRPIVVEGLLRNCEVIKDGKERILGSCLTQNDYRKAGISTGSDSG